MVSNGSNGHGEFIRFEHVTKTFQEGERERAVLKDLDASIASGEFVAMIGRSGSGKSTLLNLLAGLDLPTAGEIWIGDTCISALDDRRRTLFRRDHIGFVFQFFNLIPTLSVRENVLLTAELSGWSAGEEEIFVRAFCLSIIRMNFAPSFIGGIDTVRTCV